jgi:hypothetical protein
LPDLENKPCAEIKSSDIMAIVGKHWAGAAQSTRNRYIGYIKSIFEYGVIHGYLEKNPLATWVKGKEPRHESPLTLDGIKIIQRHAPKHLSWAIDVAWNIPARPGKDLFELKFSQVDYDREGINVYHSKVGKWAWIKLPDEFLRDLYRQERFHKSGHLIEYRGRPVERMDTSLKSAAARGGLAYPVRMNDIRHLWITTALDTGTEPSLVAKMAGTSLEMIIKNYYESHAAQARCIENMPRLRERDRKSKVVKI